MQISPSTQNNYTNTAVVNTSKNSQTPQPDTVKQETSSLNKNAYNYVDLDEDISQYIEKDPIQDKTNEELVGFLTSFINNETPEGKRHLEGYDTQRHAGKFDTDIIASWLEKSFAERTERENEPIKKELISQERLDRINEVYSLYRELINDMGKGETATFLGEDYSPEKDSIYSLEELKKRATIKLDKQIEQFKYKDTDSSPIYSSAIDGHHFITAEESTKLQRERFINLYSFSDEFSKTDKFEDLYVEYKAKASEKRRETFDPTVNSFESIDSAEYITSQVVSNDLSKAEAIEYYENIVTEFKELLSQHKSYGASVKDDVQKTIDVYEKITEGLKDMWKFGDFDIRA